MLSLTIQLITIQLITSSIPKKINNKNLEQPKFTAVTQQTIKTWLIVTLVHLMGTLRSPSYLILINI